MIDRFEFRQSYIRIKAFEAFATEKKKK